MVHPKISLLTTFTHPQIAPKLYTYIFENISISQWGLSTVWSTIFFKTTSKVNCPFFKSELSL